MSLKSPLGRVRGLGSAGGGTGHWWGQRVSAALLVPLALWFLVSLLGMSALDYYTLDAWLAQPLHAVLVILLVLALVYHSCLGIEVIAQDYIHAKGLLAAVIGISYVAHLVLAIAGVFAVVVVAVGVTP